MRVSKVAWVLTPLGLGFWVWELWVLSFGSFEFGVLGALSFRFYLLALPMPHTLKAFSHAVKYINFDPPKI